jgi:hypothetical protein
MRSNEGVLYVSVPAGAGHVQFKVDREGKLGNSLDRANGYVSTEDVCNEAVASLLLWRIYEASR